jgi:hypothetical protein
MVKPMAKTPWENYRYEYVSGVLTLVHGTDRVMSIDFTFANRGENPETARVILYRDNEIRHDTGDRTVPPGGTDGWGYALPVSSELRPLYWARIFTTSINIVPSTLVTESILLHGQSQPRIWDTYIAPRDFAVFELPYHPFPVPPPPIE